MEGLESMASYHYELFDGYVIVKKLILSYACSKDMNTPKHV